MFGSSKNAANRPTMSIDTLIGAKTRIKGDVVFSGGLRIDGHIVGTVVADGAPDAVLNISAQGSVEGEVRAPHVIINGTMNGDVIASERVELAAEARVHGNVHYKVLEMAAGAQITGRVVREDEPRKQLPKPETPPVEPAAASEADSADTTATTNGSGGSLLEAVVEPKQKSRVEARRSQHS
jgi:cytoskeletal protein CcmA (bactofilin family)